MDEQQLTKLLEAQSDLISSLAASHRALERAVFALVGIQPDKAGFLATLEKHLEVDTVSDLYEPLLPQAEQAYAAQRGRLLKAMQQICSAGD